MADNASPSGFFELEIITPERVFYRGQVRLVEFRSSEGYLGVLAGHVPTVCILEPGVLHLYEENGEKKAALHRGFAEITGEKVSILAEIAEWPEEIDLNRAKEAKIRAERRISDGSDDLVRDELALRRAIARIETID